MWWLTYGSFIATAYASCYIVAGAKWCRGAKCRVAVADAIFGLGYYPLLVILAVDACTKLSGSVASRWTLATTSSQMLGKLLASRMVLHIPIIFIRRTDGSNKWLYLLHHSMVILVYGAGIQRSRAHFWGAVAALCELTNVFLTVEELIALVWRDSESLFRNFIRSSFAISYVAMRLALFPLSLLFFARDVTTMPSEYLRVLGTFELIVYPLAYICVFALSMLWARAVFSEMCSVLISLIRRHRPLGIDQKVL